MITKLFLILLLWPLSLLPAIAGRTFIVRFLATDTARNQQQVFFTLFKNTTLEQAKADAIQFSRDLRYDHITFLQAQEYLQNHARNPEDPD